MGHHWWRPLYAAAARLIQNRELYIPTLFNAPAGRTDGRTDRITISMWRVSIAVLMRDKNGLLNAAVGCC